MTNARRISIISISALLIIAFTFSFSSNAHATLMPQLEWVRTYDSPYDDGDGDIGRGIALDATGNIYVIGYEDRGDLHQSDNIWLRKYDTDGNTLWTETYDSPNNGWDKGYGIAVDAAGNVYVTGDEYRSDLDQGYNIWLRKYDTNGNTLWTETYDSPNTYYDNDNGRGVTVDTAGNVYVTGSEERSDLSQGWNIWLRKYDTDGNTLWTQTYDSPNHYSDFGEGVAVDATGNVYITGCEDRSDLSQSWNIWLRKYDTDGNTLWTQTYDSPDHGNDSGLGVAVDATGNVYVTGCESRNDLDQKFNIWLRKYDTDGNTLWTQTYDNPAHGSDKGWGVAVDAAGNAYVTGYSYGNIWTRKYDTDGNALWTMEYFGEPVDTASFQGYDVAVDALGNVCVTGDIHLGWGQDHDIIVLKYAQIPEPSTLLLLAPALVSFAAMLRRKFRRAVEPWCRS